MVMVWLAAAHGKAAASYDIAFRAAPIRTSGGGGSQQR
jgi:hypothetical protein